MREHIAKEIEDMATPESGVDYGMASDDERRRIRDDNRLIFEIATRIRERS